MHSTQTFRKIEFNLNFVFPSYFCFNLVSTGKIKLHKPPLLKSKVAADEICHIENSQGLLESAFTVFCIRTAFQAQYIYWDSKPLASLML